MDRTSVEVQEAIARAVNGVSSDFDLGDLLVGVVRAACTLSGARYGALGVIGQSRPQLVEFVTDGLSDEERRRIGPLPEGRGLLGHLIDHPHPLRIEDLGSHPAATGFPPGHPPMTTFLGVPIKVRGRVFGNLYLTDKTTGPVFTADDEQAVVAMAHLAGIAIEHANLLVVSARRARWLEATALMPADVQRAQLPHDALVAVLERALEAGQGVAALAITPAPSGRFVVQAAVGDLSVDPHETLEALHPTLMLAMATSSTRTVALPSGGAMMTRLVIDPLTRGALVVVLPPERFTGDPHEESELVASYAHAASQALERHHARATQEQLAVLAERDRIARDLHDVVIQRLFALGLQLKSLTSDLDAQALERVTTVIGELDDTIGEIRHSIVELRQTDPEHSVRAKVRALVTEYTHVLGYAPTLSVSGPLDTLVHPEVRDHLVAILREALSNCARHASASRVWVAIDVTVALLTCTVSDDGVGCREVEPRGGLRNLAERATELGGAFRIDDREPSGCTLTWQVPL